jgi:hypothetical protein
LREVGQGKRAKNEARQLGHKSLEINGFLHGCSFRRPQEVDANMLETRLLDQFEMMLFELAAFAVLP